MFCRRASFLRFILASSLAKTLKTLPPVMRLSGRGNEAQISPETEERAEPPHVGSTINWVYERAAGAGVAQSLSPLRGEGGLRRSALGFSISRPVHKMR